MFILCPAPSPVLSEVDGTQAIRGKIRNPNIQVRNKSQSTNLNAEKTQNAKTTSSCLEHLCFFLHYFELVSNFGFRAFFAPSRCHGELSASFFIIFVFVIVANMVINLLPWDAVPLLSPGAEIDQLTALRTKRTVWIIFPLRFFAASRALNFERHGGLASSLMCSRQKVLPL